jgi:hypothetical protein
LDECDPEKRRDMRHIDGEAVISRCKRDSGGFLTEADVQAIAADPKTRLTLLLVRCGGGRFLAPADQVQHFIDIIERDADSQRNLKSDGGEPSYMGDYVRDVSLPSNETLNTIRPYPAIKSEVSDAECHAVNAFDCMNDRCKVHHQGVSNGR